MEYISTKIPNTLAVDGIVTVLRHVYTDEDRRNGELHNFPELLYINRGKHSAVVGEREFLLSAGQMLIYPPNVFHTVGDLVGAEGFILSFKTENEMMRPLCNRIFTLSALQKQTLMQIMECGMGCFVPCGEEDRADGKQGMVLSPDADGVTLQRLKKQLEFFLADIFAVLPCDGGKTSRGNRDYNTVCDFLGRNLDKNLSVSEIAEGCEMSISKLKILVREKNGGGVIELFNTMKIERSKKLISQGKLNFTDIAVSLGFGSLHYFSRAFKKYTGLSPSEYKRQK